MRASRLFRAALPSAYRRDHGAKRFRVVRPDPPLAAVEVPVRASRTENVVEVNGTYHLMPTEGPLTTRVLVGREVDCLRIDLVGPDTWIRVHGLAVSNPPDR